MKHEIEKGIPIPIRTSYTTKYPFNRMEVGDSVWLDIETTMATNALVYHKSKGKSFTARKEMRGDVVGTRVWRTA